MASCRLGWYDRSAPSIINVLPKKGDPKRDRRGRLIDQGRTRGLFDRETTTEYTRRFFHEIEGLGNVGIVRVCGNKTRVIAKRGMSGARRTQRRRRRR